MEAVCLNYAFLRSKLLDSSEKKIALFEEI